MYNQTIGRRTYQFKDLKTLLAKASPERSGDHLAGIAADSREERIGEGGRVRSFFLVFLVLRL